MPETARSPRVLARRSLLAFTAGLPVAFLAGCGDQNANAGGDSGTGGGPGTAGDGWSYTSEGYERTVKLDAPPETLVADHYSAAALWPYGIRPDGVFGYRYGDERTLRMDPDEVQRMTVVGSDGELDLEALLGVGPDLIVGFGNQDGSTWTWWDEKVAEQVARIAPFLGIQFAAGRHPGKVIEEYRRLAGKLGGDPEAAEAQQQKETFEAHLETLRQIAKRRPALRLCPLNGEGGELWVGHRVLGQVAMLEDIGFQMVGPGSDDEAFTKVNWETIGETPIDVLMIYTGSEELLRDQPGYVKLPAVEAGQVVDWDDKRPYTYASYNQWLSDLIEVLEPAERIA